MIRVIQQCTSSMHTLGSGKFCILSDNFFYNLHFSSIVRVANVSTQQLKDAALITPIDVTHEKELKLSKCLTRFPEVIDRILDDLYPHLLCDYLYELCTTFTEFYDACYCVETDRETREVLKVNMSRLLLCEATAMVLYRAFHIIGLKPLYKM